MDGAASVASKPNRSCRQGCSQGHHTTQLCAGAMQVYLHRLIYQRQPETAFFKLLVDHTHLRLGWKLGCGAPSSCCHVAVYPVLVLLHHTWPAEAPAPCIRGCTQAEGVVGLARPVNLVVAAAVTCPGVVADLQQRHTQFTQHQRQNTHTCLGAHLGVASQNLRRGHLECNSVSRPRLLRWQH